MVQVCCLYDDVTGRVRMRMCTYTFYVSFLHNGMT